MVNELHEINHVGTGNKKTRSLAGFFYLKNQ